MLFASAILTLPLLLADGAPSAAAATVPAAAAAPAAAVAPAATAVPVPAAPAAVVPAGTAPTAVIPVASAPDAGVAPAAADPAPAEGAILAEVVGLHNDNGLVGCALWNTEKGFPGDAPKALRYEFPKPEGRKAICRFEGYPPGTYAIVVYHDENSNRTLDQGFLGIPTEGWGASNDARAFMAPPKFSNAKFEYPGKVLKVLIHMRY